MLKEECGVVAIAGNKSVSEDLYLSLKSLQHRGQEAAGIATYLNKLYLYKNSGMVEEVFNINKVHALKGNVGIGHVRYSTKGSSVPLNAQPFKAKTTQGDIAIAHNGEIVNANELKEKMQKNGVIFSGTSDSEVIVQLLGRALELTHDPIKSINYLMDEIKGAFSLVILIANRVFAIRDSYGIRPLCLGKYDKGYIIASESVVIDHLNGTFIRDILPGEAVEITENSVHTLFSKKSGRAHCMFEWVYFSRPDAVIEGKLSYHVRVKLGEILAKEKPVDADIVVPVPDSGRPHALGFSRESGILLEEGLMKNRYSSARTFIMPDEKKRKDAVKLKLNAIKNVVDGKRIVLCDDSIVRGTTMNEIVKILRLAGAKEVHVRIGSPPIIAPCYYGIDMKTREELIAPGKTENEIAIMLGADSVGYISIEGLSKAIGLDPSSLCLGCVTGKYPIKVKAELSRKQKQLLDFFQ